MRPPLRLATYDPSTICFVLLTLFASYLSTNQTHVCSHDRAIFCSTEYAYDNPTLGATPSLMADRICVESSDYIIPTVLFVLSSQFQFLFVWRECLGLQVLIVLTFLSFRFSRTVLQGRNRQNPFHGQASPVGVWSFLSSSSTRRAVKKGKHVC